MGYIILLSFLVVMTAIIAACALLAHRLRQKKQVRSIINSQSTTEDDVVLIGRHWLGGFHMAQPVIVTINLQKIRVHAEFRASGSIHQKAYYDVFDVPKENIENMTITMRKNNKEVLVKFKAKTISEQGVANVKGIEHPIEFSLYLKPYHKETSITRVTMTLEGLKK